MPPPVATFLLSSATEPEELLAQCRQVAPTALQIVDAVDPAAYALLRRELPALRLVQVVHVTGEQTVAEALAIATLVDALLLDSGSPDAPVRLLGGTGKVHDWAISRRIVERRRRCRCSSPAGSRRTMSPRPSAASGRSGWICAPGLRTEGALDEAKLAAFMQAVAAA